MWRVWILEHPVFHSVIFVLIFLIFLLVKKVFTVSMKETWKLYDPTVIIKPSGAQYRECRRYSRGVVPLCFFEEMNSLTLNTQNRNLLQPHRGGREALEKLLPDLMFSCLTRRRSCVWCFHAVGWIRFITLEIVCLEYFLFWLVHLQYAVLNEWFILGLQQAIILVIVSSFIRKKVHTFFISLIFFYHKLKNISWWCFVGIYLNQILVAGLYWFKK